MSADDKCSECGSLQPSQLFDPCCRMEALRRANREISRTDIRDRIESVEDEMLQDGHSYGYGGEVTDHKELNVDRVASFVEDILKEFGVKVTSP